MRTVMPDSGGISKGMQCARRHTQMAAIVVCDRPLQTAAMEMAEMPIKRVLIADDHPLYREAERAQVERAFPGAETILVRIEHGSRGEDPCRQDLRSDPDRFDDAPGSTDARGVERVVEAANGVPVVVVSGSLEPHDIRSCIAAGAKAFVPKTIDPQVFSSALNIVAAGGTYVPVEYLHGEPKPVAGRSRPIARSADTARVRYPPPPGRWPPEQRDWAPVGHSGSHRQGQFDPYFSAGSARANRAQAAAIAVEMKLFPKPE